MKKLLFWVLSWPTPVDGLWEDHFKAYEQVSAQITRWFRHFSVYIGGENLTGFRQKQTIIKSFDKFGYKATEIKTEKPVKQVNKK